MKLFMMTFALSLAGCQLLVDFDRGKIPLEDASLNEDANDDASQEGEEMNEEPENEPAGALNAGGMQDE